MNAAGIVAAATGAGHFQIGTELRTFSFTAVKDSDGNTSGQAQLDNRSQAAVDHISIDCLNVIGSTENSRGS